MKSVLFLASLSLCSCSLVSSKNKPQLDPNLPRFTIDQKKYDAATPSETSIRVNRKEQKARLVNKSGEVILETDVSTGIPGRVTPLRTYWVRERIVDKRSNKYGQYVDKDTGEVVVKKAWEHKGRRPDNTIYRGIAMPYWMRLTDCAYES